MIRTSLDDVMDALDPREMRLRQMAEHFLIEEAALLDNWQLDAWLGLFTPDGHYEMPTTDCPDGDPSRDLMFIDDNMVRLRGRIDRLNSRFAHREYPFSRTRRLVTNVRVVQRDEDAMTVESSFAVYRARAEQMAPYVGRYRHRLVVVDARLMIRHRRAELTQERLNEHGAVSIIL